MNTKYTQLLSIFTLGSLLAGCGSNEIDVVKSGHLSFDTSLTVNQALSNREACESISWDEIEDKKGRKIIEYKCSFDKHLVKKYYDSIANLKIKNEIQTYETYMKREKNIMNRLKSDLELAKKSLELKKQELRNPISLENQTHELGKLVQAREGISQYKQELKSLESSTPEGLNESQKKAISFNKRQIAYRENEISKLDLELSLTLEQFRKTYNKKRSTKEQLEEIKTSYDAEWKKKKQKHQKQLEQLQAELKAKVNAPQDRYAKNIEHAKSMINTYEKNREYYNTLLKKSETEETKRIQNRRNEAINMAKRRVAHSSSELRENEKSLNAKPVNLEEAKKIIISRIRASHPIAVDEVFQWEITKEGFDSTYAGFSYTYKNGETKNKKHSRPIEAYKIIYSGDYDSFSEYVRQLKVKTGASAFKEMMGL